MSSREDGEVVETSPDGKFRLRIVPDTDPLDPRKNGDFVTNIASPKNDRYFAPEPDGGPYGRLMRHFDSEYRSHDACELFERAVRMLGGAAYFFDSAGYNSGPILHVIYLTKEAIEAELASNRAVNPDWAPDWQKWLEAEAKEYIAWANGDAWGYVVEQNVTWIREDQAGLPESERDAMATWDEVDSSYGYFDQDYCEVEGRAAYNWHVEHPSGK